MKNTVNQTLDMAEDMIASLHAVIREKDKDLEEITRLRQRVAKLEKENERLQAYLLDIKTAASRCEAENDTLNEEIERLRQRVAELEAEIRAFVESETYMREKYKKSCQRVADLEKQVWDTAMETDK